MIDHGTVCVQASSPSGWAVLSGVNTLRHAVRKRRRWELFVEHKGRVLFVCRARDVVEAVRWAAGAE